MDVSFLAPVFARPGPYATVCADVRHTSANAATELDLQVRALAERLTDQGAPDDVVHAVRARLLEGNEGGEAGTLRGRALVVASDGSVVLDQALVEAPPREVAEWSPTPDLMPVLRSLPDRVGADITYVGAPGQVDDERDEVTVDGDSFQIRKVQVGGWAHHRFQHNAENKWVHNADDVASRITSMARRLSPRFVLLAGDVRARQILTDRAGDAWADLVVSMDEGGRAAGADREPVDRREAELVADEPEDETLLVGSSPLELGVDQHDMDALGIHGDAVPAERAMLAAAVASSAAVVVLPRSAMPDEASVAAVLRSTDASTRSA